MSWRRVCPRGAGGNSYHRPTMKRGSDKREGTNRESGRERERERTRERQTEPSRERGGGERRRKGEKEKRERGLGLTCVDERIFWFPPCARLEQWRHRLPWPGQRLAAQKRRARRPSTSPQQQKEAHDNTANGGQLIRHCGCTIIFNACLSITCPIISNVSAPPQTRETWTCATLLAR